MSSFMGSGDSNAGPGVYTLPMETTQQPVLSAFIMQRLSFLCCSFLANGWKPNQLDISHLIVCNKTLSSLIDSLFPYQWGYSSWALANALHNAITTWLPEWLPYQTKMSEYQALFPEQTSTPRSHPTFLQKPFPLSLYHYNFTRLSPFCWKWKISK